MHIINPSFKTSSHRVWKQGVRVLGIAESFQKREEKSTVAGVIMRGDFHIDGFSVCSPEVGGLDATSRLIEMYNNLNRSDIHAWLLSGSIISWFNIIDLNELNEVTGIPVISVSYSPSEGIDNYLEEYFPKDWEIRADIIKKNGIRIDCILPNEMTVYVLHVGLDLDQTKGLLELFTVSGRIPEPIRVARILAAAIRRDSGENHD